MTKTLRDFITHLLQHLFYGNFSIVTFFQEIEQSQMVGSIANRAITDLIREGNTEGLKNFLESRKSHVDDKDEVMFHKILLLN